MSPLQSCSKPLFENEAKCEAIDLKMIIRVQIKLEERLCI